jgi:hypothetical protein
MGIDLLRIRVGQLLLGHMTKGNDVEDPSLPPRQTCACVHRGKLVSGFEAESKCSRVSGGEPV